MYITVDEKHIFCKAEESDFNRILQAAERSATSYESPGYERRLLGKYAYLCCIDRGIGMETDNNYSSLARTFSLH